MSVIFCAVVVILIAIAEPDTMSEFGIALLVGAAIPAVFAALSQTFLILAGDIDLGVGSALGLANVVAATLLVTHFAAGVAALVGLILAYAAMGWLVEAFSVPAMVVTLGASFIWLGIALVIQPVAGGTAPMWLSRVYDATLPLVPEPVYILVAATGAAYWILSRTGYGVVMRAFGNRPEALSQVGRSRFRTRITFYALAGVCVVLGGLAITALSNGSDANASATYTLSSIAAAVIGGAEFGTGIGSPIGSVLGALALAFMSSLLSFFSVSTNYDSAVLGLSLIVAFGLRRTLRRRSDS
jgi:ribose transport system ATP-binding protein